MERIIYLIGVSVIFHSCGNSSSLPKSLEGKIEKEQISVTTKVPGKVEEIRVKAGQFVQKGDTLIVLELSEVEAKALKAQGALDDAQTKNEIAVKVATDGQMQELQAKVDGLKQQYDFAQKS